MNWIILFFKRLLKRKSYIFLLCAVFCLMTVTNCLISENSVLKIALCKEDNSAVSDKAIKFLLDKNTNIQYLYYDSIAEAEKATENHKVDAVWIFKADLDKRVSRFASKKTAEPFVEIIEREENTLLRLEREALISSLFEEISFQIFKNCAGGDSTSESELRTIYTNYGADNSFIQIHKLNSEKLIVEENVILTPIRGVSALAVLFAALMGAMTFLKDNSCGKYDWLPVRKRLLPAFASCFTASFLTGAAVCVSSCFSSFSQGILKECTNMLFCIIVTTGFCLNFCLLFKSYEKLGASLPGIITAIVTLSPIFVDITSLKYLQMMFPLYYYLYGGISFVYCFLIYLSAVILNFYRYKKQIV